MRRSTSLLASILLAVMSMPLLATPTTLAATPKPTPSATTTAPAPTTPRTASWHTGDWIALGSLGVALASLGLAFWSQRTARKAQELSKAVDQREVARHEARRLEQARRIIAWIGFPGAPEVEIENAGDETVTELHVAHVELSNRPGYSTAPNRRVRGANRGYWEVLPSGSKGTYPFDIIDPTGAETNMMAFEDDHIEWRVTITFRDAEGQRWRRTNREDPRPIED